MAQGSDQADVTQCGSAWDEECQVLEVALYPTPKKDTLKSKSPSPYLEIRSSQK